MLGKYGNVSLAKVHAGGARSYNYGENAPLPQFVRSSVSWYEGSGMAGDSSLHMVLKGRHPGFPNENMPQADYTTHAETGVTERWPMKAMQAMNEYGRRNWEGGGVV